MTKTEIKLMKMALSRLKAEFANAEKKKAIEEVVELYLDVIGEFTPLLAKMYEHPSFSVLFDKQAEEIGKRIFQQMGKTEEQEVING